MSDRETDAPTPSSEDQSNEVNVPRPPVNLPSGFAPLVPRPSLPEKKESEEEAAPETIKEPAAEENLEKTVEEVEVEELAETMDFVAPPEESFTTITADDAENDDLVEDQSSPSADEESHDQPESVTVLGEDSPLTEEKAEEVTEEPVGLSLETVEDTNEPEATDEDETADAPMSLGETSDDGTTDESEKEEEAEEDEALTVDPFDDLTIGGPSESSSEDEDSPEEAEEAEGLAEIEEKKEEESAAPDVEAIFAKVTEQNEAADEETADDDGAVDADVVLIDSEDAVEDGAEETPDAPAGEEEAEEPESTEEEEEIPAKPMEINFRSPNVKPVRLDPVAVYGGGTDEAEADEVDQEAQADEVVQEVEETDDESALAAIVGETTEDKDVSIGIPAASEETPPEAEDAEPVSEEDEGSSILEKLAVGDFDELKVTADEESTEAEESVPESESDEDEEIPETAADEEVVEDEERTVDEEESEESPAATEEEKEEGESAKVPDVAAVADLVAKAEKDKAENMEVIDPKTERARELFRPETQASRWAFWRRPSKRDQQLARISEGYLEMVDLVRAIRSQLESQNENNLILRDSLAHLPEAMKGLDSFSKSQRTVGKALKEIHGQLKKSGAKDQKLVESMGGFNDTLKGMDDTSKATMRTFDRVQERMRDSDIRMENLFRNVQNTEEKVGETMVRLQRNMAIMQGLFLFCLMIVIGVLVFTVVGNWDQEQKNNNPVEPAPVEETSRESEE